MPRPIDRGFVKICGVTNVVDAQTVVKSGASALGLILAASPRHVSLVQAQAIAKAVQGKLVRCAVFRNSDDDNVLEQLDVLDVEMVQIHGNLSARLLDALRERPLTVVKAITIDGTEFTEFDESTVDAVLIDGPQPGSGVEHSWDRLDERVFRVPVIVAGGLNASNVSGVVAATRAWGVDCASGVESAPGRKDQEKTNAYVANARHAFALLGA